MSSTIATSKISPAQPAVQCLAVQDPAAERVMVAQGADATTGKLYLRMTAVSLGDAAYQANINIDGINPPGPYYVTAGGSGGVYVGSARIAQNAVLQVTLLTNAYHTDVVLSVDQDGQTKRYRFSLPLVG